MADINENKNQMAASPAAGLEQKVEAGDETLNFNVMPHVKSSGAVFVEPKIQVKSETIAPGSAPSASGFAGMLKKYKLYLLCAVLLLIGGPAAYFLVPKLAGNSYKPDVILVKNDSAAKPKDIPAPVQPLSDANFATPKDWRDKYFPNCSDIKLCGDSADPDNDGLTNAEENKLGTDPNNPDSDNDGLADGDEVKVFGTDPLNAHTGKDKKYTDADYIRGGYSFATDKKLSTKQLDDLANKMKQIGLHQPTLNILGDFLKTRYRFENSAQATDTPGSLASPSASSTPGSASGTPASNASSTALSSFDMSLSARQDRDTQRSNTIKNIEAALVLYHNDNKSYPPAETFADLYSALKPYLKVATDPVDPINQPPYAYAYSLNSNGSDFTLTFYSEVAGQPIKKTAADANADSQSEAAAVNDNERETDLDSLRVALLLYSQSNVAGSQDYVFPSKDKYQTALVPDYISAIPKDPVTGLDYDYEVSATFNSFTLKATLDNPPKGNTGYICNETDECHYY